MLDRVRELDERILELIRGPQYDLLQAEKDAQLTPILRDLCSTIGERCTGQVAIPTRIHMPSPAQNHRH